MACQRDMGHKHASSITFLANVIEFHERIHEIPRMEHSRLDALRVGLERKAALEKRCQKALLPEELLVRAIDAVKSQDDQDLILFICATGYRVEDTIEIKTTEVYHDARVLRIETSMTKNRKSPKERVIWHRPIARLWQARRVIDMIIRRVKAPGAVFLFRRSCSVGKNQGLLTPIDVQRVQHVLNAVELSLCAGTLDEHLTSYSFRIRFIHEAIESNRAPNGHVDWAGVQQETLHLDSKTLKSAYDRLVVSPSS